MSIFVDNISDTDDILEKWYRFTRDGWMIPKLTAPREVYDEGDYCTIEEAFKWWKKDIYWKIEDTYHFRIKRVYKSQYINAFKREVEKGEIQCRTYKGEHYYNRLDICRFNMMYEVEIVLKYCKKHNFHWNG